MKGTSSSSRSRASASCAIASDERERDHGVRRLGQVAGEGGQGGAAARGHPRDDAALAPGARQRLLPGAALDRGPPALLPLRAVRRRGRLPGPPGLRALHAAREGGGDPGPARGPRARVLRDDRRRRGRPRRAMSRPALEYQDTAVGRLPRGPAADAALAPGALGGPAADPAGPVERDHRPAPVRAAAVRRVAPVAAALAALAATIAIVLWRRSSS